MIRLSPMRVLRAAAFLALAGLAFMVWSLFDPRPVPVMAAMSLGQALGMLSFALYLGVVIVDARRAARRDEGEAEPDPEAKPEPEPKNQEGG